MSAANPTEGLRQARRLLAGGHRDAARAIYRQLAAELYRRAGAPIATIPRSPSDTDNAFAVTVFDPPRLPMLSILHEVAEAVCHGLQELGMDAVITTSLEPTPRRRILLGTGCLPNARALGIEAPLPPLRADTILYQLDQIDGPEHFLTSSVLPWFMTFPGWDYSATNVEALHLLGLDQIRHVPLGYVPQWTRIPEKAQDIDVLFYGRLSPRRRQITDELHRRGVKVVCLAGIFGKERDDYIARARIVLNVHHYAARVFEYPRVLYLLANRKCVVSETGTDPGEKDYVGGVDFAEYGNLVATCLRLLDAPGERDRIGEEGFRLVRSKPMSASLKKGTDLFS